MLQELTREKHPNASDLIRIRDSAYATDMFVAAISGFDFFTFITAHPADDEHIRRSLALAERPFGVMIDLFSAWGLLEHRNGKIEATPCARTYLNAKSPEHILPYILSLAGRPSVTEMIELLRKDRPADWQPGHGSGPQEWKALMQDQSFARQYIDAMDRRGALFAPLLAAALDTTQHERLLDVAGGSGIYTAHLLQKNLDLTATVLDRPPVDGLAREALTARGLASRSTVIARDMFVDPLPDGHDLHLYSHVLHNWPEDKVRLLIGKSYAALAPGGEIAIFGSHVNDTPDGPAREPMAEYSVLLAFLYEGRCYGIQQTSNMLLDAGFRSPGHVYTPCHRSLITARKPEA